MNKPNFTLSHRISRRSFLRGSVLLGSGAVLTVVGNRYRIAIAQAPVAYRMRVLHTNDHHARIEPATVQVGTGTGGAAINRNFGGVSRRKTLVDQIRAATTDDLLLLDAGDVFQGTLYFNQFVGQADLFFYNALAYDAMAVGNHEFDQGQGALLNFINGATFPILSANLGVDAGTTLAAALSATPLTGPGKLGPRTIITKGSGKKIGVFGLTPPDTGILANTGAGITFGTDLVAIAQAQVDALKAEGAEVIIGLTHVGYTADLQIAAGVRGINLIIGGHSHTPLLPTVNPPTPLGIATAGPYPTLVNDPDGKQVVVCTDWEWGKWLGDMTLGFDAAGGVVEITGVIRPVWADGLGTPARALLPGEQPEIAADAAFETKINTDFKPAIAALQNTVIGSAAVLLDGERASVRNRETNLGDLIAEVMLARTQTDGADVAVTNGGGIRASIAAGQVTVGNVLTVLPFGNTIALTTITGAVLRSVIENGLSQINFAVPSSSAGRFPQIAGMRFTYNPNAPVGSRVVSLEIAQAGGGFAPVDPAVSYRVATNNFMLAGGDGYAALAAGSNKVDTGYIMADVLNDYFVNNSPVDKATDGRILQTEIPFTPTPTNTATPTATATATNTPTPTPTNTPEPTNTPTPAPTNTPVPAPSADLSIEKRAIVTGKFATFTLIARNSGPDAAQDVVITDELPANLRHLASFSTRGNCRYDAATNRVTCRLARLGRNDSVRIVITTFRKDRNAMTNTATITSSTADPQPSNNTSTITVTGPGQS
jgi:5'-nucleotidase